MKGIIISLVSLSFLFGASDIFAQKKPAPKKSKPVKTKPATAPNPIVQKEFVSAEGKFKVIFPAAPTVKVTDEGEGDLRLRSVSHRAYGGAIGYGVTFTDSFSGAEVDDEKTLKGLRNLILNGGKSIKETKLNLDGVAGLEIIYLKADQSIAQHRIYCVGKRYYEVMAVYKPFIGDTPENAIERNKAEVSKVLDSFKITK
jgi:hypothetical protein